jgi:ribosomal protein L34
VIRRAIGTLWGVYELLRLGVLTRFRFRGPYWRWRMETAFGRGMPASRRELVRAALAYGRWMHEMRKLSR